MNVEQLIEDGKEKHGFYAVNSSRAFEAGVRHAIAAMFQVVKVEELKEGHFYLGLRKVTEEWEPIKCVLDSSNYLLRCGGDDVQQSYDTFIGPLSVEFDWVDFNRRCPTPSELGIRTQEETR